jgi:hypothetical protein
MSVIFVQFPPRMVDRRFGIDHESIKIKKQSAHPFPVSMTAPLTSASARHACPLLS